MTRDDIIRMAREAGFVVGISEEHWGDVPYAKLCHPTPNQTGLYSMLENLIRKAAAAEREACARVCDVLGNHLGMGREPGPDDCAASIRARGQS